MGNSWEFRFLILDEFGSSRNRNRRLAGRENNKGIHTRRKAFSSAQARIAIGVVIAGQVVALAVAVAEAVYSGGDGTKESTKAAAYEFTLAHCASKQEMRSASVC